MKDQDEDSKDKVSELRRRAELAAAEKSLGISDVSALSPEKIRELIHELQVHQIELEMQNEELRRTQQELEASRDKYSDLYEFAPLGYFVLDQKGVILEANLTVSGILGIARAFLIGKPLASLVNKEDGDALYLHFRQVLETQSKQTCDVGLTKEDGSQIQVRLDTLVYVTQDRSSTRLRTVVIDITKRKHAEEALYAFENRYRQLFENVRDGILMVDFDTGKILDANKFLTDILGYSHEEFLNMHLWELSPLKDTHLNKAAFAELLQKGHILHEELPLQTRHGPNIDVDIVCNSHVVCGVTFIQCNIRDVTERKKTEEELQESEERLELAVQGADLGLWDLDVKSGKVVVNERAAQMAGYESHELDPTMSLFERLCHPEDKERVLSDLRAHMNRESPGLDEEYRILTKSGAWKWIQARGKVAERDEHGNAVRMAGTFLDITQRKKSELALRRLATAVDQAEEAIMITDLEGAIQYVNPAFEQDQEFYRNLWNTITQGKVWKGRFVNKCKDGAVYREDATISPVRDRSGNIVNFVAVKRDVTQELSLQKQLLQAQKMEAIGTLTGGIAHDFNNLLTVIMGFCELLLAEKEQDDPQYTDVQKIFHAAKNGADLVQRLLMFSRKAEPKPVPMNLNKQIVEVEKLLRRAIPKMVDVKLELSADLPEVKADPSQIEQVLMNLAINARDAMPDIGQLTLRTSIVTLDEEYCRPYVEANPGEYVLLEVSDTGHGMDKKTVGRIFEPFFTTKEIGRGTGLGLAMVYGIVKQHNGHITVYSRVGKGTTFRVYLPPVIPADTEPEVEDCGIMPAFGTETVLLVDDEDLVRELGARILTKFGYAVIQAANGREALDLFKKERSQISLVILDLIMPEMGGKQCLQKLLKIDPQVKVLIASGFSADASVKESIQRGAEGFVTKPFRIKELLLAVKRILDEG